MTLIVHQYLNNWQQNGRLGNQMWKIASMTGIGLKNHVPYYLDAPWNYQKYFKIPLHITKERPTAFIRDQMPYYHYEDVVLESNKVYGIEGYLQSEKYFEHCKDYIKEFFTMIPEYADPLRERFKNHLHRIGVHVRRTDFVNLGTTPVLAVDYYNEAFSKFPDDEFLVCSDDLAWCEENFKGDQFYFQKERHEDILDMYLLSFCKGIITANSSFSWWSAWLGERDGYRILTPRAWFGGWRSDTLIPKRWERIGNTFWAEPNV